eukprot:768102-Hanusia_phi.AAC.3
MKDDENENGIDEGKMTAVQRIMKISTNLKKANDESEQRRKEVERFTQKAAKELRETQRKYEQQVESMKVLLPLLYFALLLMKSAGFGGKYSRTERLSHPEEVRCCVRGSRADPRPVLPGGMRSSPCSRKAPPQARRP